MAAGFKSAAETSNHPTMDTKLLCRIAALVLVAASLPGVRAQSAPDVNESLGAYAPTQHVAGQIRIWGHGGRGKDFDGALLQSWEEEFRKYEPDVQFEN